MSSSFRITYHVTLYDGERIQSKVEALCLEQTVELPRNVISDSIYEQIVAKPIEITEYADNVFRVVAAYPVENIGDEITQLLNILYGNVSLTPGVKIVDVEWDAIPKNVLTGPSYGIEGVRRLLSIEKRGLTCTALKPLGFSAHQLAALAFDFAAGGIDIIKDDHGLANQVYAPYDERVKRCTEAVRNGTETSGNSCWYVPNITAGGDEIFRRYEVAKECGAGAVMIIPQLCSPDAMTEIAKIEDSIPIMAHPAFSGAFVNDRSHGFDKAFLYGSLWRAMGADFSIYANASGRFAFTLDECQSINKSCRNSKSPFKSTFPTPGGGMQRNSISKWLELYGRDTVFLIGGSLYSHPEGIKKASSEIRDILESEAS
jgi:ribulose-bisphosphate carboxylase large chain